MSRYLVGADPKVSGVLGVLVALLLGGCSPQPVTGSVIAGVLVADAVAASPSAAPLALLPSRSAVGGNGQWAEPVAGEVIVRLEPTMRVHALDSLLVAGEVFERVRVMTSSGLHLYRATGLIPDDTRALAESLKTQPGVMDAFPNYRLHTFHASGGRIPNDSLYPLQWHYPAINLPAAWTHEDGTRTPIPVAVVDSGILAHPDLAGRVVSQYDFISDPATAGDGDGRDADATDIVYDNHGTHVAGTIAAASNNALGVAGVSWGAPLVIVRALGATGGTFHDVLEGIAWAVGDSVAGVPDNPTPARVVNLSLGADIRAPCPGGAEAFFADLAARGVAVVAAAGNSNQDAATTFPANCASVIAVGATGPRGERAPYSNYGATVAVMAPGGDLTQSVRVDGRSYEAGVLSTVVTADTGEAAYSFYSGTSMAAPHVSGLLALLLAAEPTLSVAELRARLRQSATMLSDAACGVPAACGAGLIDAAAALTMTDLPPAPPVSRTPLSIVGALYCSHPRDCLPFDLSRSSAVTVVQQSRTPYRFVALHPGRYLLVAFADSDGDGVFGNNEASAYYPVPITLGEGEMLTDITLQLHQHPPENTPWHRALHALSALR